MEDLCTACLCAGRKLYFLNETGFEQLYSHIINEIPIYNISELCVRLCWECKTLLRKFTEFKEQIKQCYTDLLCYVQQNTPIPSRYPRLQVHTLLQTSYPEIIKDELEEFIDDDVTFDDVKSETHCEETFVDIAEVEKDKPIREKSKKKIKEAKKIKKKLKTNKVTPPSHDSDPQIPEDNEIKVKVSRVVKRIPKPVVIKEVLPDKPTCVECGKTFSSRKTYRYHLNVLHKGQNRYPCPRCGKVYQWKSNLGRHMRSHKARDSGELYCDVCDKRFASVATYRQHLRISRRHVSEAEFSFVCNDCGKKFVNKTRLRDHIDWEHLKKIKFICQLCNKAFKCHTSLYVHMQNVHRSKDKKDNLCHVCGKSYQNAAKLKYHIIAMHTSETPYKCEQCHAAFGWYSSLYRHVREVHYKLKVQPKKTKKSKKTDVLPSLMPAIPNLHQPGLP